MKMKPQAFVAPSFEDEAVEVTFGFEPPSPSPLENLATGREFNVDFDHLHFVERQEYDMWPESELFTLAENIKKIGVLQPLLVLPVEPEMSEFVEGEKHYIVYDGRNRCVGAKMAGLEVVPCRLLQCDHTAAKDILIYSNFLRREDKLSENIKALKAIHEKDPGQAKKLAELRQLGRRTYFRYLQLGNLIDGLLHLIDSDQIQVKAGAVLSSLATSNQVLLSQYLEETNCVINEKKAQELVQAETKEDFTIDELDTIFAISVPKPKVPAAIKISSDIVTKYIPADTPKKEVLNIIEEALRYYYFDKQE